MLFYYLIFDFFFSLCLTCFVYFNTVKFYKPLYYIDKEGNKVDLREKYDEFAPRDKLDFFDMFLNGLIFAFPKLFLSVIVAILCKTHIQLINYIYPNASTDKSQYHS